MLRKFLDEFGFLGIAIILAVLLFVGLLGFRVTCVTFVDNYELGYTYDARTGNMQFLNRTGYVVAIPLIVSVHTIDLRPMQVCMNANARVLNCKLVKFNPDGFDTFIAWHGRGNYDGGNCATSTSSTSCGNLNEILRSYAFDDKQTYPFFTFEKAGGPGFTASEAK